VILRYYKSAILNFIILLFILIYVTNSLSVLFYFLFI